MRTSITVNIPEDIQAALDDAIREADTTPDELLCEALRDYLFIRKFKLLREYMTSKAKAQGIHTDQDVFDRIS